MSARKKGKFAKKKQAEKPKKEGWWPNAEPLGEFLPKFIGFNYYHLHNDGVLSEGKIDDKDVVNVEFEAEYLELSDMDGAELKDSPPEPVEGILSIPMSVARKIRAFCEEQKWTVLDVADKILRLQKTGTKINTRYPTVKLFKPSEYYEE